MGYDRNGEEEGDVRFGGSFRREVSVIGDGDGGDRGGVGGAGVRRGGCPFPQFRSLGSWT